MTIRFSHDWNSKVTGSNEIFTTVRSHTTEKMNYYLANVGKKFFVMLGKKKVCEAELVYVEEDRMGDISFPFLAIDTGLTDHNEIYKLFDKFGIKWGESLIVLVFKKIKITREELQKKLAESDKFPHPGTTSLFHLED